MEFLNKEKLNKDQLLGDISRVLLALNDHPFFWYFSLGPIRLFPHQIFVIEEALRNYPVRRIIGDEVGLGKTLEAAAIAGRLVKLNLVKRVLILCPGGLKEQWRQEMLQRLNLRTSLVLDEKHLMIDAAQTTLKVRNPFDSEFDEVVICSWHLARKYSIKKLILESHFDLVIVDEAHAAKISLSSTKKENKNLLYALLEDLSIRIPNILLVTATPVQLEPFELFGILRLLGLGGLYWSKFDNFKNYYEKIADYQMMEYQDILHLLYGAIVIAERIVNPAIIHKYLKENFNEKDSQIIFDNIFKHKNARNIFNVLLSQSETRKISSSLLALLGPIHWYVLRNTRTGLEEAFGDMYNFPKIDFRDIDVSKKCDPSFNKLRVDIKKYLVNVLPESLEYTSKSIIGFIKSTFTQRFCSSFYSFERSLEKRKKKLLKIVQKAEKAMSVESDEEYIQMLEEEEELDLDEVNLSESYKTMFSQIETELFELGDTFLKGQLDHEIGTIDKILDDIGYLKSKKLQDPKIQCTIDEVEKLYLKGQKILVFSRYIDTLSVLEEELKAKNIVKSDEIAVFTGRGSYCFTPNFEEKVGISKEDITIGLEQGRFSLILCSDAASEGFNLQAASVVMHVDIPWNPSKLEQRIGRVNRLGHDPSVVIDVVNLWYGNQIKIEKEMYSKILNRKDLRDTYLGIGQDIISDSISKAVYYQGSISPILNQMVKELEKKRQESSKLIEVMSGMRASNTEMLTLYERFENCMKSFISIACKDLNINVDRDGDLIKFQTPENFHLIDSRWTVGSFEIGNSNYLSLGHPFIIQLLIFLDREKYRFPNLKGVNRIEQSNLGRDSVIQSVINNDIKILEPHEIVYLIEKILDVYKNE